MVARSWFSLCSWVLCVILQDANIRLLRRVTSEAGRASCAWAWLRLGLHHLALHEYDKAIQAFHCTLTINPNDRFVQYLLLYFFL